MQRIKFFLGIFFLLLASSISAVAPYDDTYGRFNITDYRIGGYTPNYVDIGLTGTTDFLNITTSSSLKGKEGIGFCTWVYFRTAGSGTSLGRIYSAGGNEPEAFFQGNVINLQVPAGGTSCGTPASSFPYNTWTHYCFVTNSSYARLYVNGVNTANNTNCKLSSGNTTSPVTIGNRFDLARSANASFTKILFLNNSASSITNADILAAYNNDTASITASKIISYYEFDNTSSGGGSGNLTINESNKVYECNNTIVGTNTTSVGINVGNYYNITIKNCNIKGHSHSINISNTSAHDITLQNITCTLYQQTSNKLYCIYNVGYQNITARNINVLGVVAYRGIYGNIFYMPTGLNQKNVLLDGLIGKNVALAQFGTVTYFTNTITNVTIINSHAENTSYYGILGGVLRDLKIFNVTLDKSGGNSISPRANNTEIYNNTFNMSGHKMGSDMINNDSGVTQGWNMSIHHNYYTSTGTTFTGGWQSEYYLVNSSGSLDPKNGDYSNSIRCMADINFYNNWYNKIWDNDTSTDGGRGIGVDYGDCSYNIHAWDEIFTNVTGNAYYLQGKNITIRNAYICPFNRTDSPSDAAIAGSVKYTNNITTVTFINNTACTGYNFTIELQYNNRSNISIYQNATTKVSAANSANNGGWVTFYGVGDNNDVLNGTGHLLSGNISSYTVFVAQNKDYYITALESSNLSTCITPANNTLWTIDMSENCLLNTNFAGNISLSGAGSVRINATINTSNSWTPVINQVRYFLEGARVY